MLSLRQRFSKSAALAFASALAAFSILAILQSAAPAYGHALPATYTIEPNSILKDSVPSQLTMSFSERPDPKISYIHILNAKNERIDNDDFTITGSNGRQATVTLDKTKLANDGVYSVSWRTMSLDDGHIAEGAYVFGVGNVSPGNIGNQQTQTVTLVTSTFDALVRWPVIVSQAAIVGGIIAHLALQRGLASQAGNNLKAAKRFALILIAGAVAIAICGTALIFLQASNLVEGGNSQSEYFSTVQSLIFNSPAGIVWVTRLATSAAIVAISAGYYILEKKGGSRSILPAILAAGSISIFSNSMLSHNSAAVFLPSVAVFADWLHFMAVSTWVGGLFYFSAVLMLAIKNSEKSAYHLSLSLPRFSLLATASLGVIGITGIYMAWIQLHTLDSLFYTQYGNNLIIKLSAALPMVLLGAYHQVKLHKSIVLMASIGAKKGTSEAVAHNGNAVSKFGKTVKIESLIGIGVLFAASLLTITSPPSHVHEAGSMPGMSGGSYFQKAAISGVDATLSISPLQAGFNTFTVTLNDAGQPPQNIQSVLLRFTNVDAGIGPIIATLNKADSGAYSVTGGYLSQAGNWKIDLIVQRTGAYDLHQSFEAAVQSGSGMNMDMDGMHDNAGGANKEEAEPAPAFDSFAWLAIGLSAAVAAGSAYYFKKSKQQLRQTIELLKKG